MLPEYWIPQDLKAVLLKNVEPYAEITENSKKFLYILQKLKNLDRLDLEMCHYLQLLKLGLYLEEYQQTVDLRRFNLYQKSIKRVYGKIFMIFIKDFDKDHPLHKSCTLIEVFNPKDATKKLFVLRVKELSTDYVTATAYKEFEQSYDADTLYNIRFRLNNYSFRCSHYALSLIDNYDITKYLFPVRNKRDPGTSTVTYRRKRWYNKSISENAEQKQAVLNIVSKSSHPAPYILYGPPGTGKTATLVESICQIWHGTKAKVLICTPSNAAADVITMRLLEYIPNESIDRIYGKSRDCSLIEKDIENCSNISNGRIIKINDRFVARKRIVISTLCTCTRLLFWDKSHDYSYIFIDEAGQSTEPESLIAFNVIGQHGSYKKCQIIISGDPQQLGPGIRSKYAAPILGQSILERLMKLEPYVKQEDNKYDCRYITKLLRNYRSHPAIIRVSNELYYDNELIACNSKRTFDNEKFPKQFPIIFHGVNGREQKESNSTSSYNEAEAKEVLDYVKQLIGKKINGKTIEMEDIGIVTPFTLQSKHLQKSLKEMHLDDVTVGTVEIFQGQEKEVIILSAVRSKTFFQDNRLHIGFLSNSRRFNVALTRAKGILVVVGNPAALQNDKNWRYFMKFCKDNNACRGAKFELAKEGFNNCTQVRRHEKSTDVFTEKFHMLNINDGRQKKIKPKKENICTPKPILHCDKHECVIF